MGKRIDAIKRQEKMTPQEVLAGLVYERALKSKDRFFKIPYYEFPCYFEYSPDNEMFILDVYYVGQEQSFFLVQPNYKSVLGIAPSVLEWLDGLYATIPPEAKPMRRRRVQMPRPTDQSSCPGSLPSQSKRRPG